MLRTVGLRASGLGVRAQSLAVWAFFLQGVGTSSGARVAGVLQFSIRNLQGFVKV